MIIRRWCKNIEIPRQNGGHLGGINSPRAQSSDQFRGARVENQGSYFLRKSAFIISKIALLFPQKIDPAWRATAAATAATATAEEFPARFRPGISSHPGIKYPVRAIPSLRRILNPEIRNVCLHYVC